MKDILICCDVGILLTPDDEEFDFYSQVYDNKYGYYDEDQIAYREADLDKAIKYANEYVANGVDMTYAVITNQGQFHYVEPFDEGNIEGFTYDYEDVIYSVAKINGKIVKNFINNNQVEELACIIVNELTDINCELDFDNAHRLARRLVDDYGYTRKVGN